VQFSGIKSNRGNTISNYTGEPEFKYCSLCWKPTVFTINAIQTRSELKSDQITYLPKIIGSRNYCETHDPSDSQSSYRKHLKRKDIFLNEVEAIYKGKNSNFRIPTRPVAFSSDDVRKLAYGLVHSRFKGNKEIVYLLTRQGIKQADIARRLGISRQAVSKLKASITKELERLHSTKWLTDAPERTPIFESLLGNRVIDFSLWAYSF
jgi:DNA-binding CsgD family transcriptional regulator